MIHRSLIGHPDFRNDAEAMAFAWMIMKAAWKPVRLRYKGRAVSLERGQLCVSQRDMATALDRDKAWVERLWKRLQTQGAVRAEREAAAMLITICNYDKYQEVSKKSEAVNEAAGEADVRQTRGTEQRREPFNEETKDLEPNGSRLFDLEKTDDENPPPDDDKALPAEVVEAWNLMAARTGLPTVVKMTEPRRKRLKTMTKQYTIDDFADALAALEKSSFCKGERTGWRADFDFFLQTKSFTKLLEGSYD